jgi:hypothetical protein
LNAGLFHVDYSSILINHSMKVFSLNLGKSLKQKTFAIV